MHAQASPSVILWKRGKERKEGVKKGSGALAHTRTSRASDWESLVLAVQALPGTLSGNCSEACPKLGSLTPNLLDSLLAEAARNLLKNLRFGPWPKTSSSETFSRTAPEPSPEPRPEPAPTCSRTFAGTCSRTFSGSSPLPLRDQLRAPSLLPKSLLWQKTP